MIFITQSSKQDQSGAARICQLTQYRKQWKENQTFLEVRIQRRKRRKAVSIIRLLSTRSRCKALRPLRRISPSSSSSSSSWTSIYRSKRFPSSRESRSRWTNIDYLSGRRLKVVKRNDKHVGRWKDWLTGWVLTSPTAEHIDLFYFSVKCWKMYIPLTL